jgi:hypothetical protein
MSAPTPTSITRFASSIYDSDFVYELPKQHESACCHRHCREKPARIAIDAHGRGYGVWVAPRPLVERASRATVRKTERVAALVAGLPYPRAAFDALIDDTKLNRYARALNMHDGAMRRYVVSMIARCAVSTTRDVDLVVDPELVEWLGQPIFAQLDAYSDHDSDVASGTQEEWETEIRADDRHEVEIAAIITLHPDTVAHVSDRLDAYFAATAARLAVERASFDSVYERTVPVSVCIPRDTLNKYRLWKRLYFDPSAWSVALPSTARTRVMCATDWAARQMDTKRNGVVISDASDWREFQYDLRYWLSGNYADSGAMPWDTNFLGAQLRASIKCTDIIRTRAPEYYDAIRGFGHICKGVIEVYAAEEDERVAVHTLSHGVLPCLEDDTNLIPDLIAIIGRYAAGTHGVKSVMTLERDVLRAQRNARDAIAVAARDATRQLESANAESLADVTGEDASHKDQGRACKRRKL